MNAPRSARLVLAAFAAFAAACAAPIQLPKDFLALETESIYQAITGDDARLWIREFEDPHAASLAFWGTAVEHEFAQQRGYEVVGRGVAKNKHGDPGTWLECSANLHGEKIGYLVALWVYDHQVLVVEFAARAEVFAARVDRVRAALKTVRY
jgi:hypothetical protein